MNWKKIVIGGLVVIIVLILLSIESKNSLSQYKVKIDIPYRMTVLDKDKYGFNDDVVVFNEMATVPEKYYTDEYECEEVRRHLYNKFELFIDSVKCKSRNVSKMYSPINSLFNAFINIRRSFSMYDSGTAEHTYYVRHKKSDCNEIFIVNNSIYIF